MDCQSCDRAARRQLSAKLTEGEINCAFLSSIEIQTILQGSLPPAKITDFCQLPAGNPVAALTVRRTVIHYCDCASLTLYTLGPQACTERNRRRRLLARRKGAFPNPIRNRKNRPTIVIIGRFNCFTSTRLKPGDLCVNQRRMPECV